MQIVEVNNENFEAEVLNAELPVLADFNADWCGPCRMLRPILDEIAEENDKVKVVSINIDDAEELAEKYDVVSIPCVVLIKNGEEVDRSIGLKSKDAILELVGE